MQRVIVTVKREGDIQAYDLDVPAEVAIEHLATLITQALQWDNDQTVQQPIQYQIKADPPGRVLDATKTLVEAGVWDGAWLVFQPIQLTSRAASSSSKPIPPPMRPTPSSDPVTGWRPLDIDLPSEDEVPDQKEDSTPTSRFVWKRLD